MKNVKIRLHLGAHFQCLTNPRFDIGLGVFNNQKEYMIKVNQNSGQYENYQQAGIPAKNVFQRNGDNYIYAEMGWRIHVVSILLGFYPPAFGSFYQPPGNRKARCFFVSAAAKIFLGILSHVNIWMGGAQAAFNHTVPFL
jgi:hypothetical protein